jgi:hypothetical protein
MCTSPRTLRRTAAYLLTSCEERLRISSHIAKNRCISPRILRGASAHLLAYCEEPVHTSSHLAKSICTPPRILRRTLSIHNPSFHCSPFFLSLRSRFWASPSTGAIQWCISFSNPSTGCMAIIRFVSFRVVPKCVPELQVSNRLRSWVFLRAWVAMGCTYPAHHSVPSSSSSFML